MRLFGGGGGGDNRAQMFQALQEAQRMRDAQGTQLALLTKNQAEADAETASMRKPGLGRALLTYRRQQTSGTLGGAA